MLLIPLLFFFAKMALCAETSDMTELFGKAFNENKICSVFNSTKIPMSENCGAQLTEACRNGTVLETMLDASSKVPYTSMKIATTIDYGGYDQCVAIDHKYSGGRILGKHCVHGLLVPNLANNFTPVLLLSPCVPDSCSADDYNNLFRYILCNGKNCNIPLTFVYNECSTKEPPPFETGDIITLVIIGACFFLMVTETIYDIYLMKKQLKPYHPFCQAFSVLYNGRKLLQTTETPGKDQIMMFQGLRVIFMFWIIAGHAYRGQENVSVINYDYFSVIEQKFYLVYVQAAIISVESFFFISGFLLSYQYLSKMSVTLSYRIKMVPIMILQRYLRLMPAALMLYLVMVYIFQHLGDGPMYSNGFQLLREPCTKYWWSYFLYIQNYVNYDNLCMVPTWYVSADMQLFVLSPLFLIPTAYYMKKGKMKALAFSYLCAFIFFTVLPIITSLVWKDYNNPFSTHCRAISFVTGLIMGTFLRHTRDKPFLFDKFSENTASLINTIGWIVSLVTMFAILILIQCNILYWNSDVSAVWSGINKPLWCLGLSWMLYSCYHGQGGFANWFLSRPFFQVLARLTYAMYLTHGLVIAHYISRLRMREYFDDYNEFMRWGGYTVMTVLVSFIWTLAFESPMITVSKVIFKRFN